ncbi:DUF4309 domain-containing protein [Bacillus niameyensis]|uniref:DUF4309 domain-containing protein n=1 Tax=Bacillus niameyensis TaxID=1522308 RepID=UPI0007857623|nr:DUF4309 domain-containing protein [Bacillus niameyensis]
MRKVMLLFVIIMLAGCSGLKIDPEKKDTTQQEVATEKAEDPKPTRESLSTEDLVNATKLNERMAAVCGEMRIEYEQAYFKANDKKPSLVAICHHDGDMTFEGNTAYIMAAVPDQDTDDWKISELAQYDIAHPIGFLGKIEVDGREILVIERDEIRARYGGRDFDYVYFEEGDAEPQIGITSSEHTQSGMMKIADNQIVIEDEAVLETYTYKNGEFQHHSELKKLDNSADLIIYFDKDEQDELTFSTENVTGLDVKPGDRISFRRKRPIPLVNFQIRTDLEREDGQVDTFIVTESDMAKTIEVGEYPFENMNVFTVGKVEIPKVDFLQKQYFNELKQGIMPNSKIQLTDSNKDIESILGPPIESIGYSGANYLKYKDFFYATPFLEEEGDKIYGILRTLKDNELVTGTELKAAWGAPTEEFQDEMSEPITLTWNYQLSSEYFVVVDFDGRDESSNVVGFTLMRNYE